ncbi:MAG: NADPH-dependent 7-cyano-7-deazaguanine reductase QueF [Gammaproteobacteria bacterium]|nr:NADPH-dependent 7-cyano-7-deazaguanine reductase QueF [Gammaproteobacteria bacterium]
MSNEDLLHTPLGKKSRVSGVYDPAQLCPIARAQTWLNYELVQAPWHGVDIWNAWEISWLNNDGMPQIATAELRVPASSLNIIESKSLKLYLNSFNQSEFESFEIVEQTIRRDLSACAGDDIEVQLFSQEAASHEILTLEGGCLDELNIKVSEYRRNPRLLQTEEHQYSREKLYSHLLKTNCPVTSQPDWGSICIEYTGNAIRHESLLRYIVSYRNENDFHEQCVENIFLDIMHECQPESLTVYARYLRRGGLDINPWRSTEKSIPDNCRLLRQ